MTRAALSLAFGMSVVVVLFGWIGPVQAMTITQLDLTGGAANYDGRFHRQLDHLLAQDGTLLMGQYQPTPDIVSPLAKGQKTFSLFTSGLNGAAAPSATVTGSSITVDLSSLFFGVMRGDSLRAWNIGGLATGVFNPETSEFFLSWDHLFNRHKHADQATFFLKGKIESAPQPIPVPASLVLYVTGLLSLGSWTWWRNRAGMWQTSQPVI